MKMKLALALLALVMVTGCATSRSVVNVGNQPSYNNANPDTGLAVKIELTDARDFQLKPPSPDIPSLKNGEIDNPNITARAIGRKRNAYGKALGDILLPEGQTVIEITRSALTNGFRQAGYRVLTPNDPGYAAATEVKAEIKQYWSWMSPGFWTIGLHCRAEVTAQADIQGFGNGLTFESEVENRMMAGVEDEWQKVATQGLEALTENVKLKLPRQTAANQ